MIYDFHPEARLEYREAAVFYEERRPGLGAAFTVEVEATIGRILERPRDLGSRGRSPSLHTE